MFGLFITLTKWATNKTFSSFDQITLELPAQFDQTLFPIPATTIPPQFDQTPLSMPTFNLPLGDGSLENGANGVRLTPYTLHSIMITYLIFMLLMKALMSLQ